MPCGYVVGNLVTSWDYQRGLSSPDARYRIWMFKCVRNITEVRSGTKENTQMEEGKLKI